MVRRTAIIEGFVGKLKLIPDLVTLLAGNSDNIVGYFDSYTKNSITSAVYQQKAGTVMVAWEETSFTQAEMQALMHTMTVSHKPITGVSPLDVIDTLVNGVPVPGDGQVWRACPVTDGLDGWPEFEITRVQDGEGIDYHLALFKFKEIGDKQ